jgi:hypothetical protein
MMRPPYQPLGQLAVAARHAGPRHRALGHHRAVHQGRHRRERQAVGHQLVEAGVGVGHVVRRHVDADRLPQVAITGVAGDHRHQVLLVLDRRVLAVAKQHVDRRRRPRLRVEVVERDALPRWAQRLDAEPRVVVDRLVRPRQGRVVRPPVMRRPPPPKRSIGARSAVRGSLAAGPSSVHAAARSARASQRVVMPRLRRPGAAVTGRPAHRAPTAPRLRRAHERLTTPGDLGT